MALEVRDRRGEPCFRTDATLGAIEGEAPVSFEIPRLALLGGDYELAVGVWDHDAPPSRSLDWASRFSVTQTLEGEGIADLRGSWTIAGRRAAEEALR